MGTIIFIVMCLIVIAHTIKTFWDILIIGKRVYSYDGFYLTTNVLLFCIAIFGLFLICCYW